MKYKNSVLISASLFFNFIATPAIGADGEHDGPVLWQGLEFGMTPQEALPAVLQINGVKRAKIVNERKPNSARRLDIDYTTEMIRISDLAFEVAPEFENGRVSKVFLRSTEQCGSNAMEIFDRFAKPLSQKYTGEINHNQQINERVFSEARSKSRQSGLSVDIPFIFANDLVAVVLVLQIKEHSPPDYPYSNDKFIRSLWRVSMSMYETKKSECNGSGDQRMDVVITYIPRKTYDDLMTKETKDADEKDVRLKSQL